jgi:hypothetical protein
MTSKREAGAFWFLTHGFFSPKKKRRGGKKTRVRGYRTRKARINAAMRDLGMSKTQAAKWVRKNS